MKWSVAITLIAGAFITYMLYKTQRIYSYLAGILTLLLAYYFYRR